MYDYSEFPDSSSRKFAKTCVEKKRRDRINKSLDELKELMAFTDERARYQKFEKAEILEMTVNYIRTCTDSLVHSHDHHQNGYDECSGEIWKFVHSYPHLTPAHRQYLIHHCRETWLHRRFQRLIERNSPSKKLWKPYM